MVGYLYRYSHPINPELYIYCGQGNRRDSAHRRGKTSFGRKFKKDFPDFELPQPFIEVVDVRDQLELNELETIWMFQYHTWRPAYGGYNIILPGSQDYRNLGKIAAETHKIRHIGLYNLSFEQRSSAGSLARKLNAETTRLNGLNAAKSGQLLRAAKRGGETRGSIQGQINVDNGHLDRIRSLPQTKAAIKRNIQLALAASTFESRSRAGKAGSHEDKVRAGKSRKNLSNAGHVRWHVNRHTVNPKCKLCREPT